MQMLVEEIESMFKSQKHCFVRPDDLRRAWPSMTEQDRERVVGEFAREHGWRIFTYSRVFGAMFVRD
jgi:hypothetical protein